MLATVPRHYFGEGTDKNTKAKPEIWTHRADFDSKMDKMVTEVQKLPAVGALGRHGGPSQAGERDRPRVQVLPRRLSRQVSRHGTDPGLGPSHPGLPLDVRGDGGLFLRHGKDRRPMDAVAPEERLRHPRAARLSRGLGLRRKPQRAFRPFPARAARGARARARGLGRPLPRERGAQSPRRLDGRGPARRRARPGGSPACSPTTRSPPRGRSPPRSPTRWWAA